VLFSSFKAWLENTIPIGDCFRFATKLATNMFSEGAIPENDIKVVHATVKPEKKEYAHAWVEAMGRCYDWQMSITRVGSLPIKEFYKHYKPKNIKKYTPLEAVKLMVKNNHFGPWE